MFRKIRSKRAPEKTVWADLWDELGPYIRKINHSSILVLSRFPRTILVCMVIALIYSVLWSFKPDRKPGIQNSAVLGRKKDSVQNLNSRIQGLNSISKRADELRRTITIRNKVDSVLNKKELTRADSSFLEDALRELRLIQEP
ncbi:hypothetical protein SAMN04488511_102237 [Pedobacter suwonensis]|uniref:Uncharacterized protein n=1 Tax=Pedobacter suwonensis TaxID=332999 RepID=A0A1I0SNI2_9SPHI|nr:hypothetical protein [Pedobacter suwonensis]SFA41081.1 hypothetical protein SAMN04488511_102237 [Pedobacter suwonensis]